MKLGMMKVAFCNRSNCFDSLGGDTVQMVKTSEALNERYSVDVEHVLSPCDMKKSSADIFHVFNIQNMDETFEYVNLGRQLNKKVVLSSIFWDMSHSFYVLTLAKFGLYPPIYLRKGAKPVYDFAASLVANMFGRPRYYSNKAKEKMKYIVESADLILPNSAEELSQLERYLKINIDNYCVVTNAVDGSVFHKRRIGSKSKRILCAARIEPAKNQLGLVKALFGDKDIEIVLVGAVGDGNYYEHVRKALHKRGNGKIIAENLPQLVLSELYGSSAVHVLPSFRESPGLSSIESLATGTNAVISSHEYCPVDSYFAGRVGKDVFICDPYKLASIRYAVLEALNGTIVDGRMEVPTWSTAADQTYKAYCRVLKG